MRFNIKISEDAARDLQDIHVYISADDSPAAANHVVENIVKAINRLEELPHRGNYPSELLSMGVREYREIFFKPYRIIYGISGSDVQVFLITDGRRDMQALLATRLLMS